MTTLRGVSALGRWWRSGRRSEEAQGRDEAPPEPSSEAPRDVTGEQPAVGSDGASSPPFPGGFATETGSETGEVETGPPSGSWRRRRRGWGSAEDVEVGPPPPPDARPHGPTTGPFPMPGRTAGPPSGGFPMPGGPAGPPSGLPVAGRPTRAAHRAPPGPVVRPFGTDGPTRTTSDDPVTPPQRLPRGRRGHARHADRDGDRRLPHADAAAVAPAATPPWGIATGRPAGAHLVDPRPALRIDSAGCG